MSLAAVRRDLPHLDREQIEKEYLDWLKDDKVIIFRKKIPLGFKGDSKYRYFYSKMSKRGNSVYSFRTKKRFDTILTPALKAKSHFGNLENKKTNCLFITLTYDTKITSLNEAWSKIGVQFNRFLSNLKRRFGQLTVCRCFEAFYKSAYPHIHAVIWFDEMYFSYEEHYSKEKVLPNGKRFKRKTLRIDYDLKEIINGWYHSNIDIEAVENIPKAVHYLGKYILKNIDPNYINSTYQDSEGYYNLDKESHKSLSTMAMCWVHRKRTYSLSKKFKNKIIDIFLKYEDSQNFFDSNPETNDRKIFSLNLIQEKSGFISNAAAPPMKKMGVSTNTYLKNQGGALENNADTVFLEKNSVSGFDLIKVVAHLKQGAEDMRPSKAGQLTLLGGFISDSVEFFKICSTKIIFQNTKPKEWSCGLTDVQEKRLFRFIFIDYEKKKITIPKIYKLKYIDNRLCCLKKGSQTLDQYLK